MNFSPSGTWDQIFIRWHSKVCLGTSSWSLGDICLCHRVITFVELGSLETCEQGRPGSEAHKQLWSHFCSPGPTSDQKSLTTIFCKKWKFIPMPLLDLKLKDRWSFFSILKIYLTAVKLDSTDFFWQTPISPKVGFLVWTQCPHNQRALFCFRGNI